jgi:hypothetical protein
MKQKLTISASQLILTIGFNCLVIVQVSTPTMGEILVVKTERSAMLLSVYLIGMAKNNHGIDTSH